MLPKSCFATIKNFSINVSKYYSNSFFDNNYNPTSVHNLLRNKLKELGSDLIIRRGECVEVLRKLHNEHPFETIWAHQETGNWISYHRDLKVLSWAKETGIKYNEFYHNGCLLYTSPSPRDQRGSRMPSWA